MCVGCFLQGQKSHLAWEKWPTEKHYTYTIFKCVSIMGKSRCHTLYAGWKENNNRKQVAIIIKLSDRVTQFYYNKWRSCLLSRLSYWDSGQKVVPVFSAMTNEFVGVVVINDEGKNEDSDAVYLWIVIWFARNITTVSVYTQCPAQIYRSSTTIE